MRKIPIRNSVDMNHTLHIVATHPTIFRKKNLEFFCRNGFVFLTEVVNNVICHVIV